MIQEPLFEAELEAVYVIVTWAPREGWTLRVSTRELSGSWKPTSVELYERLAVAELLDVLEATVVGLWPRLVAQPG